MSELKIEDVIFNIQLIPKDKRTLTDGDRLTRIENKINELIKFLSKKQEHDAIIAWRTNYLYNEMRE